MKRALLLTPLPGLLLMLTLYGQTAAATQDLPPQNLPDMELLEFLGTFEDRDTGWLDPFEISPGDEDGYDQQPEEDNSDER